MIGVTRDERRQWRALQRALDTNFRLWTFIEERCEAEEAVYMRAEAGLRDDDLDAVLVALRRAQLAAYQEWLEREV